MSVQVEPDVEDSRNGALLRPYVKPMWNELGITELNGRGEASKIMSPEENAILPSTDFISLYWTKK